MQNDTLALTSDTGLEISIPRTMWFYEGVHSSFIYIAGATDHNSATKTMLELEEWVRKARALSNDTSQVPLAADPLGGILMDRMDPNHLACIRAISIEVDRIAVLFRSGTSANVVKKVTSFIEAQEREHKLANLPVPETNVVIHKR
jgi:hypothetical protein